MDHQKHEETTFKDYLPLVYVFIFIIAATWFEIRYFINDFSPVTQMRVFMGFFFLVFGFFKILAWKDFARTYASYDIIAKRSMAYSYVYPLIELLLGVAFLLDYHPVTVNFVTLAVMLIGSVGVAQNLLAKNQVQCACLGTLIKVPLSKISLMEDLLMAVMALATLIIIL